MRPMTEERYNAILEKCKAVVRSVGFELVMNSQEVEGDFRRGDSYTIIRLPEEEDGGEGDLAWCVEEAVRYHLKFTVRGRYESTVGNVILDEFERQEEETQ